MFSGNSVNTYAAGGLDNAGGAVFATQCPAGSTLQLRNVSPTWLMCVHVCIKEHEDNKALRQCICMGGAGGSRLYKRGRGGGMVGTPRLGCLAVQERKQCMNIRPQVPTLLHCPHRTCTLLARPLLVAADGL